MPVIIQYDHSCARQGQGGVELSLLPSTGTLPNFAGGVHLYQAVAGCLGSLPYCSINRLIVPVVVPVGQ